MIDQIAIFFLAGHETSAAALAWALYLLARYPAWQEAVAEEAHAAFDPDKIYFSTLSRLKKSRAVFREAMRLYPPVPMFVREAACPETFRARPVRAGSQVIISPWHLHRHERLWERPDAFEPARFDTENGKACLRNAYIPFSAGARVCPGSAFAMAEGTLLLDMVAGRNLRNPDPNTPDSALFWFRLLTWIWFPIQFALVFGALYYLTHIAAYPWYETLAIMFAIGETTGIVGIVGIVYSHELIHKSNKTERNLGDLLLTLVLYGHFRTEHLLVHHPWVATPRDTVTARYNEGFHHAFFRSLSQGPGSAWRRMFNPKVRAWRRQFYPEIEDWTPYKTASLPLPKGSE